MPKLIIGNGFNEAMIGDTSKTGRAIHQTAAIEAKRLAWLIGKDDLLVLPSSLSQSMIHYISKKSGEKITSENFISIAENSTTASILTSRTLLEDELISRIQSKIIAPKLWEILPYFLTSSTLYLAQRLKIPTFKANTFSFLNQSGADLLNSKIVFRALAAEKIRVAPGFVCRNSRELYFAMHELLLTHSSLIIKQNMNASGDGNIAVTLENRLHYPGVREIFRLTHPNDVTQEFVEKIWLQLYDSFGNHQLVIEAFLKNTNTIYAEYEIHSNSDFDLLNYGIVRMDQSGDKRGNGMINWVGFQIPFSISQSLAHSFFSQCDELVKMVSILGYRGRINMDAIITDTHEVVLTEINGRLGGCTHVHHVAQQLLGPQYLETHFILTRNRFRIQDLQQTFQSAEALCNPSESRGVIILNEDQSGLGIIEYFVYAKSLDQALSIEQTFLQGG